MIIVAGVYVSAAAILHAVEDSRLIVYEAAKNLTVKLDA